MAEKKHTDEEYEKFRLLIIKVINKLKKLERDYFYPNYNGNLKSITNSDVKFLTDDTLIIKSVFEKSMLNNDDYCFLLQMFNEHYKNNKYIYIDSDTSITPREFYLYQFEPNPSESNSEKVKGTQRFPWYAHEQSENEIQTERFHSLPFVRVMYKFSPKSLINNLYQDSEIDIIDLYFKYLFLDYKKNNENKPKKQKSLDALLEYTDIPAKTDCYHPLENTATELQRELCFKSSRLSVRDFFLRYVPNEEDLFPFHISKKSFQAKLMREESEALQYLNFYKSLDIELLREIIADLIMAFLNIGDENSIKEYLHYNWVSYNEFLYIFNKREGKPLTSYIHKANQERWCLVKLLKLFIKNIKNDPERIDPFSSSVLYILTNKLKQYRFR